jgi:hypothetical protein
MGSEQSIAPAGHRRMAGARSRDVQTEAPHPLRAAAMIDSMGGASVKYH